jgi:hypothetical protein
LRNKKEVLRFKAEIMEELGNIDRIVSVIEKRKKEIKLKGSLFPFYPTMRFRGMSYFEIPFYKIEPFFCSSEMEASYYGTSQD